MAIATASPSLQLSLQFGICANHRRIKRFRLQNSKTRGKLRLLSTNLSSFSQRQSSWSTCLSKRVHRRVLTVSPRNHQFKCHCILNAGGPSLDITCIKNATLNLIGTINRWQGTPLVIKLASATSIVIFAIWGLGPLARQCRNMFLRKSDNSWKNSSSYHLTTSYIQPLLLWAGAIFICRALDPVILPLEAGQIVKQRLLNFVRSLSTVLAFAHCLSSVIQQSQKFFTETNDPIDTRNMGFQFAGRAVYSAVWVAAVSLFMELLGFSTQKWITAGGLGTVLLTLAGREIFTNFLSSVMIHATRPFVLNEWIQTKIDGYEVSGTVEHVGWWSPTIIRGDDREAVHIPNHKFTVNVVRNLSQKTHWRIKTHLAISHLDVGKINNIVADMRKVLAKNPQVEQQKLHRRVFLDVINSENQALSIMVSCFVKTSRFEEYMCVKEAILLDLLRVISHHRARLATPIRTVQKVFTDADLDSIPFSETIFTQGATSNRPLILIEPSYKINGEDKTKTQTRSPRVNGDEEATDDNVKEIITSDDKAGEVGQKAKVDNMEPKSSSDPKFDNSTTKSGASSNSHHKQDVRSASITKSSLEENIVLGVALDGSKRTLPIEEDMVPQSNLEDTKELAISRSGKNSVVGEKAKNDNNKGSNASNSPSGDQLDQQD